jgi:hypothetical protein
MRSSSGTLEGGDFYSVLWQLYKGVHREFHRFFIEIRQTDLIQKEFNV